MGSPRCPDSATILNGRMRNRRARAVQSIPVRRNAARESNRNASLSLLKRYDIRTVILSEGIEIKKRN